jgi:hypothetical protein
MAKCVLSLHLISLGGPLSLRGPNLDSMMEYRIIFTVFAVFSVIDAAFVSIRGHPTPQKLPMASVANWQSWTYDLHGEGLTGSEIVQVPDALNGGIYGDGWIAPTTFHELFLPADLPMPQFTPALGVCVAQGVPRYVMPSCVLSLTTPEGEWRNRGLKSLPRAQAWIDAFSPFGSTSMGLLELSVFIQAAPNVKFLEDQDGASNWRCFNSIMASHEDGMGLGGYKGNGQGGIIDSHTTTIKVDETFNEFSRRLKDDPYLFDTLQKGYHFVDIPLTGRVASLMESTVDYRAGTVSSRASNKVITGSVPMPPTAMKMYLSDFEDPKRLLQFDNLAAGQLDPATAAANEGIGGVFRVGGGENSPDVGGNVLDSEPCGELVIQPVKVSPGRESEFLPECYKSLFEEGNVMIPGL